MNKHIDKCININWLIEKYMNRYINIVSSINILK